MASDLLALSRSPFTRYHCLRQLYSKLGVSTHSAYQRNVALSGPECHQQTGDDVYQTADEVANR